MVGVQFLKCINPFQKPNHTVKKNLVKFPLSFADTYPSIPANAKICLKCRLELSSSLKKENSTNDPFSPVSKKYKPCRENCTDEYHRAGVTVLEQMKEKFRETQNKQERILLLTLTPKYWSRDQLQREFSCSEWEARKAQKLMAENGILTSPIAKKGKVIPDETVSLVKSFYERDDNSRLMPGMKDFLSVKNDNNERVHVQKRLLLGNLLELYALFKKEYENVTIGYTKFTQLKPPHCILAGSSGTHNVCVCVHHENVKLMLSGVELEHLTKNTRFPLKNYHDCINAIVCAKPLDACFLGDCLDCPNTAVLKEILLQSFNDNNIYNVKFETWMQTDRCSIVTQSVDTYEYLNLLDDKLMKLKTHDFFARKQSVFIHDLKKKLLEGEFLVCFDFAENYAFVVQNSAQSFHWNNNQATIFTVVIYFQRNNELQHKSLAIISDNLSHDTIAVHVYQEIIINYLKKEYKPKKIYYSTDGAGQHFKNQKSFSNLINHKKDFGIPAEWHFCATAHGKGACDGIGANVKRGAKRASLQLSANNHILTAEGLFEWARNYCKETMVFYSKKEDYEQAKLKLKERFDKCFAIQGTLQFHAFIPTSDDRLMVKKISSAEEYEIFPRSKRTGKVVQLKHSMAKSSISKP